MNLCHVKAYEIWGHLLLHIIQPILTNTDGLEAKSHSGQELISLPKKIRYGFD